MKFKVDLFVPQFGISLVGDFRANCWRTNVTFCIYEYLSYCIYPWFTLVADLCLVVWVEELPSPSFHINCSSGKL